MQDGQTYIGICKSYIHNKLPYIFWSTEHVLISGEKRFQLNRYQLVYSTRELWQDVDM